MATTFLSPVGNDAPFMQSAGVPASGFKLFSYTAGTTTKAATYQDNAAATPNANPILLNSQGYPASGGSVVEIWLTQGVNYKFVFAPSTDTDPPTSPVWTRDNISGIDDPINITAASEWIQGTVPTFISTTSFSVAGDQRTTYQVNRRIKTTNSGGTIYSRITASSFGSSITTVTVLNDSGVLDSGLVSLSYGVLAPTNASIPSIFTPNSWITGRATADQNIASNVTIQNATNMSFSVLPNEEWVVDGFWDVGAALATTGINVGINAPSGAVANLSAGITLDYNGTTNANAGSGRTTSLNTAIQLTATLCTGSANALLHLSGWVLNGATAGTVQLMFAQQTTSVTNVTVRKGSHMIAYRVGG